MKKKTIAGLIAIVVIVLVVVFAGFVEEEEITSPTPTVEKITSPTPTPTSLTEEVRISSLIEDLGNPSRRDSAIKALVEIGYPAIEPLINALEHTDRDVREGAAEALGEIGDPRAVEPLIKALNDKDSNVRRAAMEALEKLGWKPRSLPTGTFIVKEVWGGYGELTIKNGVGWDAVVVLSKLEEPKKSLLSVYIQLNDSYTITNIPDGVYILYYALGKDWDNSSKKFTITKVYGRFEEELRFKTTITGDTIHYTRYTATLYPVLGGTAETEVVDEADFPRLS